MRKLNNKLFIKPFKSMLESEKLYFLIKKGNGREQLVPKRNSSRFNC